MLKKLLQLVRGNAFRSGPLFTFRRPKRTRSDAKQEEEEEEEAPAPAPSTLEARRIVRIPLVKKDSASASAAAFVPISDTATIDEMAERCHPQRRQIVEFLWTTCEHLFPNDVFDRYSIFSLAVYLFDAFTLHQFQLIEDNESRQSLFRFSTAALFNTSCALAPPCILCCLILASKIDCNYSVRVFRKFELAGSVTYYFECQKFYHTEADFTKTYCIFESENKEGKNYQLRCSRQVNQDTDHQLPHVLREMQFRFLEVELSLPAYVRYVQNFEFFMIRQVLPFFPDERPPHWLQVQWIFPNPCLYQQVLRASLEEERQDEKEEEEAHFLHIGELVRARHCNEFSFGRQYFENRNLQC